MAAAPPLRRADPSHAGLRQLGIFVLAYIVYFGVRAITQGSVADATDNALRVIRFERGLGIAWEGATQNAVLQSGVLVDAANAVYVYGHWPVLIIGGFLLFRYRREHYFRLRDVCLLSGLIGLLVFALFPVAPPRLTGLPLVDTVTRNAEGYRQLIPDSLVNEYAAMPSFHAGWNVLLGIVVFGATRNPLLRALSVVGPALMIAAVVLTANHYVVDVVAGVAIVLACLLVPRCSHPSAQYDAR
jgi:membrane-associated phospholipid phosphatase